MRSPLRQFTKFTAGISLVLMGSAMLIVFQNCGGMAASYNPLYDTQDSSGCIGVSCYEDLSLASATSSAQTVLLEPKTAGTTAATCDGSTCFDIGGFCNTGGFPAGIFYYQWLPAGKTPGVEMKASVSCDENGRWRMMLKVPFADFDFTPSSTNKLRVFMHIIDDKGQEAMNPNGRSEMTFGVSTRP